MTARTMFDRLAALLEVDGDTELAAHVGLPVTTLQAAIRTNDMSVTTLRRVHERARMPIGILAEWWLEGQDRRHAMRPHEKLYGLTAGTQPK